MNIYVGNLSYDAADEDLRQAFAKFGQVEKATVIKDKFTGRSKGFGFVEMPVEAEAKTAIETMNGEDIKGRGVRVNEARPRAENREESNR